MESFIESNNQKNNNQAIFNWVISKLDPISKKKCLKHKLKKTNKILEKSRGTKKYIIPQKDSSGNQFYQFGDEKTKMFPEDMEGTIKSIITAQLLGNPKELENFLNSTGIGLHELKEIFKIENAVSNSVHK